MIRAKTRIPGRPGLGRFLCEKGSEATVSAQKITVFTRNFTAKAKIRANGAKKLVARVARVRAGRVNNQADAVAAIISMIKSGRNRSLPTNLQIGCEKVIMPARDR